MYADMEMWSEIRRRVLTGELTKRAACREYDLHWETLEKILAHVEPPGYRRTKPRHKPKIEPFLPIIEEILESDRKAPKKQRHTAQRIWERLRDEHGFTGKPTIVKDAVRAWRNGHQEVFLPLSHRPGEAQVDFGFAQVKLNGQATKVALFVMTLPYSDALVIQVFPRECTEAFLEGHKRAFAFFGGVPRRISYDNSKIAVAKITGSRQREVTKEFLRLKSHFLFQDHFCLVRRPNEKGHVERLLDFARTNYLVPVPEVASLVELNAALLQRCQADLDRQLYGKSAPKAVLLEEERPALLPIPPQEFEARRVKPASVSSLSLVRFDTNNYSVPVKYAHRKVLVVATVDEIRLVHEDRLIARHPRHWGREKYLFEPVHYLALLERKPGGFDFARPLENWNLPSCFETLRRRLEREPNGLGMREFIRVLRLLEHSNLPQLTDAVEYALDLDITDADSIRVILEHRREQPVPLFSLDGRPHLKGVTVEPTDVSAYQSLLVED
ncbi:MAG TPA: IS21 family transposase [Planctomycetaceae bacterium]|nr:IS21 family transposase [Planctomycetaceae bacterium]